MEAFVTSVSDDEKTRACMRIGRVPKVEWAALVLACQRLTAVLSQEPPALPSATRVDPGLGCCKAPMWRNPRGAGASRAAPA